MSRKSVALLLAIATGLGFTLVPPARSQQQVPAKDAKTITDEKTIRALIVQLGDEAFDKRDAAQKQLAAVGELALDLLRKAVKESTDPESCERLSQLIQTISSSFFREIRVYERDKANNNWSTRLAVKPDGKQFVTVQLGALRCLNVADGKQALAFEVSNVKTCWGMDFSADGSRLIVGSDDNLARVFDMKTGKLLKELPGPAGGAALLPDGKRAVTGGGGRSLRLWDVESGREIRAFENVPDDVHCLAVSPDGKLAAVGHTMGFDVPGAIRLWDVESGKEVKTLNGHSKRLCSVRFSQDGKTLLSSSFDGTVRLWDVAQGKLQKMLEGHPDRVEGAAFTRDGKRVISVGNQDNPIVVMWDAASGALLYQSASLGAGYLDVAPLPDGHHFLICGKDGFARLWEWKR